MAEQEVKARLVIRSDTAANWGSFNPVLKAGETGFETDTGKIKIGNGTGAWNSLPYSIPSAAEISVTAIEGMAATDVQAALVELRTSGGNVGIKAGSEEITDEIVMGGGA